MEIRPGYELRLGAFIIDGILIRLLMLGGEYGVSGVSLLLDMQIEVTFWEYFWSVSALYCIGGQGSSIRTTPGKALLGLMVVDSRGKGIGYGGAALRYIFRIISIVSLFGVLPLVLSNSQRGIHDRIAGSFVVFCKRPEKAAKTDEDLGEPLIRQSPGEWTLLQKLFMAFPWYFPEPETAAAYAEYDKRLGAFLADVFILSSFLFLADMAAKAPGIVILLDGIPYKHIALAVVVLYFAGFEGSSAGATPGKALMGLFMTCKDGRPVGFARSGVRFALFVLSGGLFLSGVVPIVFSRCKQTFYDRATRTIVRESYRPLPPGEHLTPPVL